MTPEVSTSTSLFLMIYFILGIIVQSSSRVQYLSCATNLQLLPSFKLNDCNYTDDHVLTVSAVLDSSLVRKGCERSHGAGTSVYSKCGVKDVTDLLPNPNSSWMEDSITEETVQGILQYFHPWNLNELLVRAVPTTTLSMNGFFILCFILCFIFHIFIHGI